MKTENNTQQPRPLTPREDIEARKKDRNQMFPGRQHWFNLEGFIKTTITIPTAVPKTLADQLVIYIDDLATPTDKRLYIFSQEAGIWSYVTLT